jgi:hypothetical protein
MEGQAGIVCRISELSISVSVKVIVCRHCFVTQPHILYRSRRVRMRAINP